MSHILKDNRYLAELEVGRSEEAIAAALHARHATQLEDPEQHAFRRLCTSRATKRAVRDQRLARTIQPEAGIR